MKKTYQTPVVTAIDIAVESQILAASTSLGFGDDPITDPITDPSQADARGMGYIIDDEDEEDDGSYWK